METPTKPKKQLSDLTFDQIAKVRGDALADRPFQAFLEAIVGKVARSSGLDKAALPEGGA